MNTFAGGKARFYFFSALLHRAAYWFNGISRSFSVFAFQGHNYHYFIHRYNNTWLNERIVEIPIIWQLVQKYHSEEVLEVGNVLSHYFSVNHDIVDKYETARGVINQDAVFFKPEKRYRLIVSISTLEHVGWDEEPRDPEKFIRTVENLRGLLSPGGQMIVTLPLGYNAYLDDILKHGEKIFDRCYCLQRISRDNRWTEVDWRDIESAKYGRPFPFANALVVGIAEKESNNKTPPAGQ